MLKISDSDFEPRGSEFEQQIIDFIRTELPEHYKDIPPEDGDAMILVGIRRARKWGFIRLSDVMQFVALMVEIAANFDEQPELRSVLENHSPPNSNTISALLDDNLKSAWEDAALNATAEAWIDDEWLNSPLLK